MRVKQATLREQIFLAEVSLNECWDFLCDLKNLDVKSPNFASRCLTFQDKLAATIFQLHTLRQKIIQDEKETITNKCRFKPEWFVKRMQLLAIYKKGIDYVVNIAKSLGDAYVYFFYQFDLILLDEHLNHQVIVNSAAGYGELGEIEFLKKIKHVNHRLVLYHGITNILRYGDFSFVNLHTFRITDIGELKTKKVNDSTLDISLQILRHVKVKVSDLRKNVYSPGGRKERQLNGILQFFINSKKETDLKIDITNPIYSSEIEKLYKETPYNKSKTIKISEGLAISGLKMQKNSLYKKIFYNDSVKSVSASAAEIEEVVKTLVSSKVDNSIVLGQLLYTNGSSISNISGAVPLFWYPIHTLILKKIYFLEFTVLSLFNPGHIIKKIEDLGFNVDSRYSNNKINFPAKQNAIQGFDLFVSYVSYCLLCEEFITKTLIQTVKVSNGRNGRILVKPQLLVKMF